MAEFPRPDWMRPGHLFDPASVRRDLWILLMVFLADREFSDLTEAELDHHHRPLLSLHGDFADYEVTRILLSCATALRVLDDRDAGALNAVAETCGDLQTDTTRVDTVPLTLREACNKIMHATRINFDVERLDGRGVPIAPGVATYLLPTLYLYGEFRGSQWRAVLNVVDFVRSAAEVL